MKPLIIEIDDKRIALLEKIRSLHSDILYIWGNGSYSLHIRDYLRTEGKYDGRIIYIVDDAFYQECLPEVVSFSNYLKTSDKSSPVVFGFYNYEIIQTKKAEWTSTISNMFDFHFAVVNGKRLKWDALKAKEQESAYQNTYNMFSDERSKLTMQLYLNAATAGKFHELFMHCYEQTAYFNRITKASIVDVLVDCGAFDGDSIHDFVQVFKTYNNVIAIEPDLQNVEKLQERVQKEEIHGLQIIQKGVGSCMEEIHFQAKGESNSYIDENGENVIQITTLDEIADNFQLFQGQRHIFLKMDIEGAELDALHGAERLIRECKPVLAICVYHKEEDLIEIPQYIHKTVGDGVYNYYLGFHGLDLAELVFYAIPVEKTS